MVNSEVGFTVTDTGIGIAPGFAPHVFERRRRSPAHPGLGALSAFR
jgi:signal transduction histidine kinase